MFIHRGLRDGEGSERQGETRKDFRRGPSFYGRFIDTCHSPHLPTPPTLVGRRPGLRPDLPFSEVSSLSRPESPSSLGLNTPLVGSVGTERIEV